MMKEGPKKVKKKIYKLKKKKKKKRGLWNRRGADDEKVPFQVDDQSDSPTQQFVRCVSEAPKKKRERKS